MIYYYSNNKGQIMVNYFANLDEAIKSRFPQETPSFEKLGKGSFFSRKVDLLLYKEGKGWKFEQASIFQRIAWKIAKCFSCFKSSYNEVSLINVKARLLEIKNPSENIKRLQQHFRQQLVEPKETIETKPVQTPSQDLPENQIETKSIQKLDQSLPEVRKLAEQLGYKWLLSPNLSPNYISCFDKNISYEHTHPDVNILLGALHGEVSAVAKGLGFEDDKDLMGSFASIEVDSHLNVLYYDKNSGKIKIYDGLITHLCSSLICLGEFDTIEAVIGFRQSSNTSFLRDILGIRQALTEFKSCDIRQLEMLANFVKENGNEKLKELIDAITPQIQELSKKKDEFNAEPDGDFQKRLEEYNSRPDIVESCAKVQKQIADFLNQYFITHHLTEESPKKKK